MKKYKDFKPVRLVLRRIGDKMAAFLLFTLFYPFVLFSLLGLKESLLVLWISWSRLELKVCVLCIKATKLRVLTMMVRYLPSTFLFLVDWFPFISDSLSLGLFAQLQYLMKDPEVHLVLVVDGVEKLNRHEYGAFYHSIQLFAKIPPFVTEPPGIASVFMHDVCFFF